MNYISITHSPCIHLGVLCCLLIQKSYSALNTIGERGRFWAQSIPEGHYRIDFSFRFSSVDFLEKSWIFCNLQLLIQAQFVDVELEDVRCTHVIINIYNVTFLLLFFFLHTRSQILMVAYPCNDKNTCVYFIFIFSFLLSNLKCYALKCN